jgi:cytochrome c-type biogenesis protein
MSSFLSGLPLPIAAFIAGLISFLSPCVLPLVPGYVSLISGAGVVKSARSTDGRLMVTPLDSSWDSAWCS